ncbi:lysyl oxidase homolog 2-like [Mercenaria mercenaria]|uniref:lysyl oxidase homolog 2-like n=1 Tax=Mercenaria mercenaria TaxID=6596 RepID=UPI001E1DCCB1|nr:lysyl oxidase homolog 2-like [Mercenaria mercenaria]
MSTFIEMAYVLCLAFVQSSGYNTQFKVSYICDISAPTNRISYHGHVTSELFCGTLCAMQGICESFLFINDNSTCILNDGLAKNNETCGNGIMYGAKVIKKSCTESFGNVRLCNGSRNDEADSAMGRVEVYYDGQWGSVCDDSWEMYSHGPVNAKVVCGILGFTDGVSNTSATFGRSTGPIHLDDVICDGTEASIFDCAHNPFGENNCNHGEDVGVVCY